MNNNPRTSKSFLLHTSISNPNWGPLLLAFFLGEHPMNEKQVHKSRVDFFIIENLNWAWFFKIEKGPSMKTWKLLKVKTIVDHMERLSETSISFNALLVCVKLFIAIWFLISVLDSFLGFKFCRYYWYYFPSKSLPISNSYKKIIPHRSQFLLHRSL